MWASQPIYETITMSTGFVHYDIASEYSKLTDSTSIPTVITVDFPGGPTTPRMRGTITVIGGVPRWTAVHFDADDVLEVRTMHLRAAKLEDWLEQIVKACIWRDTGSGRAVRTDPAPRDLKAAREGRRGNRPNTVPDETYAVVAAIYKLAARNGMNPTQTVEQHFSLSRRTAERRIKECERRGLLPPTTPGKKRA